MFTARRNRDPSINQTTEDVTRVSLAQLVSLRRSVALVKRPAGRRSVAVHVGGSASRALGRGLDFSEVREYNRGDDVRMIDWKVTARSGKPHTKVYNEERERPFHVVVDLRPTMFFATRVAFKSVLAAKLASMVAWAAAAQRDRVGGLVFCDQRLREIKPAAGSKGVTRLLNEIIHAHSETRARVYEASQSEQMEQQSYTLSEVFQRLQRTAHTGSSICLCTDFSRYNPEHSAYVRQLLLHNHMAVCRIYDPLEAVLPPPGRYTVSNGIKRSSFDSSASAVRQQYAEAFASRTLSLKQQFAGHGNSYHECAVTDNLSEVAGNMLRRLPGSV
ncbi:hypothetical protein AB833_06685 [Chromatiales bacterium (ex Bugula neritina AB1)]|nr:hypothetical protein AB833_06685 [Chromatiales bacterium (ex Bugula neritina AB1)]